MSVNITQAPPRPLPLTAVVGGCIATAAALLTRMTVGSPLAVIHKLEAFVTIPPIWLLSLLWLVSFALVGAAAGYLLSCPDRGPRCEALLWRGCTFLVLGIVFSLVWYTLLFGKFFLLPSWLCLILSAASSLVCALSWMQVKPGAAVAVLGFLLWQGYLILLHLSVLMNA